MAGLIYLDWNASAPLRDCAREAMIQAADLTGNPSSAHAAGLVASRLLERSREIIAGTAGCRRSGVILCSGATEANNMALRGLVGLAGDGNDNGPVYVAVTATEHPSVLNTVKALGTEGKCVYGVIGVDKDGLVDLDELSDHLTYAQTLGLPRVASVGAASGETGAVNDIRVVAEVVHGAGGLLHSDCAQAWGRIGISGLGWDCATVSGHKIGAPAGIGAVLLARSVKPGGLPALIQGGGQENGLRAGTPNLPGTAAMAAAAHEAVELDLPGCEQDRLRDLRGLLESLLRDSGVSMEVLGPRDDASRLANTLVVRFPGADADAVLAGTGPVAASSRSACSSGTIEPPVSLIAMGLDREAAFEVVRLSMGHSTTDGDVVEAARWIADSVRRVVGSK